MSNEDKYTLTPAVKEETELFYHARNQSRDNEIGCIGHLRADFGQNGLEFWTTWEDHCPKLKTQDFKDELDNIINQLRENGILKNFSVMSAYCYNHSQAKLVGGREYNYGFKIKTDKHIYHLRCCTLMGDYNLYCYVYERNKLEKCFATLPAEVKPSILERLEANKQKATQTANTEGMKQKEREV